MPRPSLWRLGGLSGRQLVVRVWTQVWADEVLDRAAALSFYFLFALFPALLILTALFGLLSVPTLMDQLLGYSSRVLPPPATSLVRTILHEVVSGATGGVLSLGVLATLWAASNGMVSIITALNAAYGAKEVRTWWKRRLVALGLTLGFSLLVLAGLLLMVFGPQIGVAVATWLGLGWLFSLAWSLLNWPIVILFMLTGISLVYHLAPAIQQPYRWATPGSTLALAGWLLVSFGLRQYVAHGADYTVTYGSLGGVILLLLWLYLSGFVLLIGAEVDSEITRAAARREGSST